MKKFKDITGQKFGCLTALYRLHSYHKKGTYWLCICECGNLVEVYLQNLQSGHTTSCGCLKVKHNKCDTRLYSILRGIKTRCYNKNVKEYKYYGKRGIAVCDEWLNDFNAFYDWAMENGYNDTLTIDRIDVDGNYSPDNCRWIPNKEQQQNKRKTKLYTINDITKTLAEWCEVYNINYNKVYNRVYLYNWEIERALELNE